MLSAFALAACSGTLDDPNKSTTPASSGTASNMELPAVGTAPVGSAGGGAGAGAAAGGAGGISLTQGGAGGAPLPSENLTPDPPPLPQWSASVGSWCGPGDGKTIWLVANPTKTACDGRAENIYGGGTLDGFSVELPEDQLGAMPVVLNVPVRHCEGGVCETLDATFNLTGYSPEQGVSGDWQVTLADGVVTQGQLAADWCNWDETLPAHPEGNRLAAGLQLKEVSIYQAVKIPIMMDFETPNERNAPVVAGRPALVRVFAEPQDDFEPHEVRARLTLENEGAEPLILEETQEVTSASVESDTSSTFNFEIPPEAVQEDTKYSVELLETVPCSDSELGVTGARFPELSSDREQPGPLPMADLGAVNVGVVKVQLVPVRYDGDGSGRLPDTSEEMLELYHQRLMQVFPVSDVILTVREEPVGTNAGSLEQVLGQIRDLRARENPARDQSYYGLIRFTDTFRQYCNQSCVTGIAGLPFNITGGAGTGIGYSDEASATTFVHEVGHINGREHSPCQVNGDRNYPYQGGIIGSWGYDIYEKQLYAPDQFADFMGYCNPTWVSDYVYASLAGFLEQLNATTSAQSFYGEPAKWRTVILKQGQAPSWGLTSEYRGVPDGAPEEAIIYGPTGAVVEKVTVYRTAVADQDMAFVTVPAPTTSNWWGIGLDSSPVIPFENNSKLDPFH